MLKAVILIGGPQKGTRFRPLSLEVPKPLFPVAGFPMIYHHVEACSKVPNLKEIIITGFYQPSEPLTQFINSTKQQFKIPVRYLQEFAPLGTAGGIYHFRDQILSGGPELFFVLNADVCCEFPLTDMLASHKQRVDWRSVFTLMTTEATRQQSLNYGCIVENVSTHEVLHYVEKPETYISTIINCGVYLFSPAIFDHISKLFLKIQEEKLANFNPFENEDRERIQLEQDIFVSLADTGKLYSFNTQCFWSQIKTAGAAIYANRHYLGMYHRMHPERLAKKCAGGPQIIGDVFIHETAQVDPSACLGPNVTIGRNAVIGVGVRVRESMIMGQAVIQDHSLVIHSIIGWKAKIGMWSRVEGTPDDPNPNKPFAKLESKELFSDAGKLNPSITVIGSSVQVPSEVIILNSIVLPHKDLSGSFKNRIIL